MSTGWPELVDAALATLSSDRSAVGLSLHTDGDRATVTMGGLALSFGDDPLRDELAWELLADALPHAVELGRLRAMHRAAGVRWPAPWSVHATSTVLAWLTWATGGIGTSGWAQAVGSVLAAADDDCAVKIQAVARPNSFMSGVLRARKLSGLIRISPRVHYTGAYLTLDQIPNTVAVTLQGRDMATIIDAPWLRGADVTVRLASVGDAGTAFEVDEASRPLTPIPAAAMAAAPPGFRGSAPWIVTARERAALDDLDLRAHGGA